MRRSAAPSMARSITAPMSSARISLTTASPRVLPVYLAPGAGQPSPLAVEHRSIDGGVMIDKRRYPRLRGRANRRVSRVARSHRACPAAGQCPVDSGAAVNVVRRAGDPTGVR